MGVPRVVATSIAVAVCGVALYGALASPHEPGPRSEAGVSEGPGGREEWQRLRFADPRTGEIPDGARQRAVEVVRAAPTRGAARGGAELEFVPLGPTDLGGRTRALAVDVSDPRVLVAGGISGGLWRSVDEGRTWTRTTRLDQALNVSAVVQDTRPGREGTWYAATGEGTGNSAGLHGEVFLVSTDGARSWDERPLPDRTRTVWALAIHPTTMADVVFMATPGGVYRSEDGGQTWGLVLEALHASDVAVTPAGTVYATTGGDTTYPHNPAPGIWRSEDAGETWVDIAPPDFPDNVRRGVLGLAPSDERVAYLLAYTPEVGHCGSTGDCHSFWKLVDGVEPAWENRSGNLTYTYGDADQYERGFAAYWSYNLEVAVRPDDPDVVYLGGIGLLRSTDGFASTAHTEDITSHHADQHAVVFDPRASDRLYVGSDGGVHAATDDLRDLDWASQFEWDSRNDGYVTSQFYTVALDSDGPVALLGGTQDNGTWWYGTTGGAEVWSGFGGGDGGYAAFTPDYLYGSSQNGNVYRRRRTPTGWEGRAVITPAGADQAFFIHPFAVDPTDPDVMYYPSGPTLWRNDRLSEISDENNEPTAVGWSTLFSTTPVDGNERWISAVGVSTAPDGRVYVGDTGGRMYRIDGAAGASPEIVELPRPNPDSTLTYLFTSSIAVDPTDSDHVVVTYSNYGVPSVFESTDGGAGWVDVSGNLETQPGGFGDGPAVTWAEMMPTPGGGTRVLLATSAGLLSSDVRAGGETVWLREGADVFGFAPVDMIDVRADGVVAVATHGSGIYLGGALPPPPVSGERGPAPLAASLDLVYPNPLPAGALASVRFTLGAPAGAGLRLLDVRGREVLRLDERDRPAGEHHVTWRAPVAAGVYVLELEVGGRALTKRVTVVGR